MAANNPGRAMHRIKPILLLTRPEADSQRFLETLPLHLVGQCDPIIAPLFRIAGKDFDLPDSGDLILSSSNALGGIKDGAGRTTWCVGTATTAKAKSAGLDARFAGETAAQLIETLSQVSPRRFVHLRGCHTRGDIAGNLRSAGHVVQEIVAYDQVETPWTDDVRQKLETTFAVIAPVFSPRSGRLLAERLSRKDVLHVVAMSESVAMSFNFLDSKHILVASNADIDAMTAATIRMLERVGRVEGGGHAR